MSIFGKRPKKNERSYNKGLEKILNKRIITVADLKHVINEKSFIEIIEKARKDLDLTDYFPSTKDNDEKEIEDWLVQQVSKAEYELQLEEYFYHLSKVTEQVLKAIEKANLQIGWFEYVLAFIALGKPPKTISPELAPNIAVTGMSEDKNSIYVRLDRGLSSGDYRKSWKLFKIFVEKPRTRTPYAELLKDKIYLDSLNGMKPAQLAQKYFPREYQENKEIARDKVKKIIVRYKITP